MTKYKNIRYKEKLQWVFNLKWQKTNDQAQWKLRATSVTTQIQLKLQNGLKNIIAFLIGFQYLHIYPKKRNLFLFNAST